MEGEWGGGGGEIIDSGGTVARGQDEVTSGLVKNEPRLPAATSPCRTAYI